MALCPLFLVLLFLRASDIQYWESNSQKHHAKCLNQTYFEMGTTSSMSKPTRGLWFNCFTNPLSTTYLKWICDLSEKKVTEVSTDRHAAATHTQSEPEHISATIAAKRELQSAGYPCHASVYRMLQIIPPTPNKIMLIEWSWNSISN